jgi:FtsZ-interacting cell division protein ZipA
MVQHSNCRVTVTIDCKDNHEAELVASEIAGDVGSGKFNPRNSHHSDGHDNGEPQEQKTGHSVVDDDKDALAKKEGLGKIRAEQEKALEEKKHAVAKAHDPEGAAKDHEAKVMAAKEDAEQHDDDDEYEDDHDVDTGHDEHGKKKPPARKKKAKKKK